MSKALKLFLILTLLTGMIYPLTITLIAYMIAANSASGSLLKSNGKVIGSLLIGQKFESERYFWGRPSAIAYNPFPSGGSNLSQTSSQLKEQVAARLSKLSLNHPPADLLFTSGSGIDPHISSQAAKVQADRVAKARGIEAAQIVKLIESLEESSLFSGSSSPYVNVLKMNIALDGLSKTTEKAP